MGREALGHGGKLKLTQKHMLRLKSVQLKLSMNYCCHVRTNEGPLISDLLTCSEISPIFYTGNQFNIKIYIVYKLTL